MRSESRRLRLLTVMLALFYFAASLYHSRVALSASVIPAASARVTT